MELIGIVWHVLAAATFVAVIIYLNRRYNSLADRNRLLWTLLLDNRQNLPPARRVRLGAQVLVLFERELAVRYRVSKVTISHSDQFETCDLKELVVPLWTLVLASARDFSFVCESPLVLNGSPTSFTDVAKALQDAKLVTLSWKDAQWHFAVN